MLLWLVIIILAYLFFSLSFFGDKLLLSGPPHPKLYTFYVGMLSLLVVVFIPFTRLTIPGPIGMAWIILEALVYILGLYAMFIALAKFDVSRVVPAIGAIQPIFILFLTWLFWGSVVTGASFLAFVVLLLGSILISVEKKLVITREYMLLVVGSSFMFSLAYVFSKLVFLDQSFLPGLIWMNLFTTLFALVFLFDKKLRREIFAKKQVMDRRHGIIFFLSQSTGGLANILQSFAISLVPVGYLATLNSLRGMQYVFLFIITLFFSYFYPKTFKEDISKKVIIQKTIAIALICIGLAILISY